MGRYSQEFKPATHNPASESLSACRDSTRRHHGFTASKISAHIEKNWDFRRPADAAKLIEGLRLAGAPE
jgi:hypothetical protein